MTAPAATILRFHVLPAVRNALQTDGWEVLTRATTADRLYLIAMPWTGDAIHHTPRHIADIAAKVIPAEIIVPEIPMPHNRSGFVLQPTPYQPAAGLDRWTINLDVFNGMRGRPADATPLSSRAPHIRLICETVADYYGVQIRDMLGPRRNRAIVQARSAAMTFIRRHDNRSLASIGDIFGGRDHATVRHAIHHAEIPPALTGRIRSEIFQLGYADDRR